MNQPDRTELIIHAASIVAEEAAPLTKQILDPITRMSARSYGAAGILDDQRVYTALWNLAVHYAKGATGTIQLLDAAKIVLDEYHAQPKETAQWPR